MNGIAGKLRAALAVVVGKALYGVGRLVGTRGSSLPGLVVLKLYPGLLGHFSHQLKHGAILVTGTNGKTTTNNLMAQAMEKSGLRVVANREGANLERGVATAFIRAATITGALRDFDWACLEADEAAFPKICAAVKPSAVIVTNFFRDQLDRYWEIDKTVSIIRQSLEKLPGTIAVLNADDPLVAQLGLERPGTVYYGIGQAQAGHDHPSLTREARFCPRCGAPFTYEFYHYSQLGMFSCPSCSFHRPNAQVDLQSLTSRNGRFTCRILLDGESLEFTIPAAALYHVYNCLAVLASMRVVAVPISAIEWALNHYRPATGRMQQFIFRGHPVRLNLVKNPAGFNENIALLKDLSETTGLYLALNDNAADGRDVSWIWDVNIEALEASAQLAPIVCSGRRAGDIALRLKYAGFAADRIAVEPDIPAAVASVLDCGHPVFCLATYTALWPTEKALRRLCPGKP